MAGENLYTPGIKLAGIMTKFREGLPNIEGVNFVQQGYPVESVPGFRTPAIFYAYVGSRWIYKQSRCVIREGAFEITIVAGDQSEDLAVNTIFLIQDRFKAWLRSSEFMSNLGIDEMNSFSALIKSDGPMDAAVNERRFSLKHEVEVTWMERMTSNVGVTSGNGGGGP